MVVCGGLERLDSGLLMLPDGLLALLHPYHAGLGAELCKLLVPRVFLKDNIVAGLDCWAG